MTSSNSNSPKSLFWPHLTIILWSIAFLLLCGRTLILKFDRHSVYPVFTMAAANWTTGDSLYVRGGSEEFRYSPLVAATFVPLELLGPRLGEFLWRSANFAALVGGLLYCCRVGLPRIFSSDQIAAVFLLTLPIAGGSLNNAQSNPLVIGLLLLAIAAVADKRWTLSAIAVTIATLFKIYPLSLGLILSLLYPRRFGWRLLVGLAAGFLLPFFLQHYDYVIEQYRSWIHYLSTEDRQRGPITDWYRDFRAVWRIYIGPMHAARYLCVELAVAAVIALICILGRLCNWPQNVLLVMALALCCCWMTAFGPATESATYVLLAPSLALALVESDAAFPRARLRRIGYGLVFGLLIASSIAVNIRPRGVWFRDHLQPLPIAGGIFLLLLLIEAAIRLAHPPTSENV